MSQSENRNFHRVQFFRLPLERRFIPVWVFNPDSDGLSGLVINMSMNGVQILTDALEPLDKPFYELTFLPDDNSDTSNAQRCRIEQVWTDTSNSLYTKTAFKFIGETSKIVNFELGRMDDSATHCLRCALHELND